MTSILEQTDMRDAGAVAEILLRGAVANRTAVCRRGSIDLVEITSEHRGTAGATLIATGDLHDNPLHLGRLVRAAGMDVDRPTPTPPLPTGVAHLTLHELIHGDRLVNGLDSSYRVLARAAALKVAFPEHVHTLLANHEIAQLVGSVVVKDGVKCNEAFDGAIAAAFPNAGECSAVRAAVREFISSMPLALRVRRRRVDPALGDILCAHSLPAPQLMDRFDDEVLERDLTPADFQPRTGSAYLMTWGRDLTPEHVTRLAQRWDVGLFILGHEKADNGALVIADNAVVLNSDHERGVYARLDLTQVLAAQDVARACVPLNDG